MGFEANYFRWGQLEYLEHWQYFDILCTARNSVAILRVHTCLCSRVSVLLILSELSLLAILWPAVFNTLSTRTTICSRAFICENFLHVTVSTKKHLFGGDIRCICCILLSRSQNNMAQPRPQATFLYLPLRRIHLTYRAIK